MSMTQGSIGNRLLAISAMGTVLFAAAAGYGLWQSWDHLRLLNTDTEAITVSLALMGAAALLAIKLNTPGKAGVLTAAAVRHLHALSGELEQSVSCFHT